MVFLHAVSNTKYVYLIENWIWSIIHPCQLCTWTLCFLAMYKPLKFGIASYAEYFHAVYCIYNGLKINRSWGIVFLQVSYMTVERNSELQAHSASLAMILFSIETLEDHFPRYESFTMEAQTASCSPLCSSILFLHFFLVFASGSTLPMPLPDIR